MAYYSRHQNATWGACDSFFTETDEDGWYEQQAREREQARNMAKERQSVLASDLSKITGDEYQDDVLAQMEEMELKTIPDVHSIDIQTEIQWFMRPYLLDFLVEAHSAFGLIPDTLYLAVNLLDRYCSRRVVYKRHYQLVGCAALLIASKYGDRKERVPQIKELKAMCCALYEEEMFTQMEWHLLQTLDWMIGHPTIDSFLQVAMAESPYDREAEHIAWYTCELALFHKEFVSVMPSDMARSSLALSRFILGRPESQASEWVDTYDTALVARLYAHLQHPSSVVSKKYASPHLSNASATVQMYIERQNELERVRQLAPPTPPLAVGAWAPTKYGPPAYATPHTPQKVQYPSVMNHGLYTPPITPENVGDHGSNQNIAVIYDKQQQSLPSMMLPIPTPPPSASQYSSQQHSLNAESGHYLGQYYAS